MTTEKRFEDRNQALIKDLIEKELEARERFERAKVKYEEAEDAKHEKLVKSQERIENLKAEEAETGSEKHAAIPQLAIAPISSIAIDTTKSLRADLQTAEREWVAIVDKLEDAKLADAQGESPVDDEDLESDLGKLSMLYHQMDGEPVSDKVSDKILNMAHQEARRRRRRSWFDSLFGVSHSQGQASGNASVRHVSRPVLATLAGVVALSALFVYQFQSGVGPHDQFGATRGLVVEMTEEDRDQLAKQIPNTLAGISKIQQMEPASNKWTSSVDKMIEVQGPKVAKYKSMAAKFTADGDTENSDKYRDLASKLEDLFSKRNPDWLKEINKGE